MKKKLYLPLAVVFLIISIVIFFMVRTSKEESPTMVAEATKKQQDPIAIQEDVVKDHRLDISEGRENASITVIEYASLSCSHCASFLKNIYPELKEDYIEDGKVRFIFRHFPLDEPSLRAAQLVSCLPAENRKDMLKVLFESQSSWAYNKNFPEKLENIAKIAGMNGDDFHKCMADENLEKEILQLRADVHKAFRINSTPSLIINGQKYIGRNNYAEISAYLDNIMSEE